MGAERLKIVVRNAQAPAKLHNDINRRLRTPVIGMTYSKPR